MAQPHTVLEAAAQPVFEGTWDELLAHSQEFADKRVRLTVVNLDEQAAAAERARIEAIDAAYGKFRDLGICVEDLHRGRQADKLKEDAL